MPLGYAQTPFILSQIIQGLKKILIFSKAMRHLLHFSSAVRLHESFNRLYQSFKMAVSIIRKVFAIWLLSKPLGKVPIFKSSISESRERKLWSIW
jgi:hypothetical protein